MTEAVQAAASAASAPVNSNLSPMQSELLSRADAIFASISNAASKATDLAVQGGKAVAAEIPDIAFQYVAFGRAYSTAVILLGVALIAAFMYLGMSYGFKNKAKLKDGGYYGNEWHGARISSVIVGGIGAIVGFTVILANARDFILVWFAPKVWLILEMVQLVKQVKS